MSITVRDLAKMIDHSLLHPTMTDDAILRGCDVAKHYNCASVCVKPYSVKMVNDVLSGSEVKTCSVIGFPHGNSSTSIKVAETELACNEGAEEIDMVINIGKALSGDYGDWSYIKNEISEINEAAVNHGAILKVIFENDYLEEEHIIKICGICNEVQVAFVKTSTGYGFVKQDNGMYNYKGATTAHLKLMREYTDDYIQVKAAGGVRTLKDILFVRSLGVTRIGATATAVILDEAKEIIDRGDSLGNYLNVSAAIGGDY